MPFCYVFKLSIPFWSDFNALASELKVVAGMALSIPFWSDFNMCKKEVCRFVLDYFQSHFGLISTKGGKIRQTKKIATFQSHFGLISTPNKRAFSLLIRTPFNPILV